MVAEMLQTMILSPSSYPGRNGSSRMRKQSLNSGHYGLGVDQLENPNEMSQLHIDVNAWLFCSDCLS